MDIRKVYSRLLVCAAEEIVLDSANWFDDDGNMLKQIPQEAVDAVMSEDQDASSAAIESWVEKLNFNVPKDAAIDYIVSLGGAGFTTRQLKKMSAEELAPMVFYAAVDSIKTHGSWPGLAPVELDDQE